MRVSEIIEKIESIEQLLYRYDTNDIDANDICIVVELLNEYKDELLNKTVK